MNNKSRNKRKKSRKSIFPMVILTIVMLALIVGLGRFYRDFSRKTREGETVTLEIPEGSSTRQVVSLLKKKGLIRNELAFYLKLYQSGNQRKLRYGTYDLNSGMSLDDLIEALVRGAREDNLVLTIPEGFSVEQIGARLEEKGIMTAEEFCQAVKDAASGYDFGGALPREDTVYFQLQGYLYPDTYYLEEDTTPEQLVSMLLEEFESKFDEKCMARTRELGMTVNEVLTRASLVEKETDLPEEYATIAGVINNRLNQKMRLQFDSTVVYGMTDGQYGIDRVMYSHLEDDSAYNTYKIPGLPPGPICNPGIEAIMSVLYPEEHNYLFFMMDSNKNDGSNLFFETYEEHMAAYSTMSRDQETKETEEAAPETSTTEGN